MWLERLSAEPHLAEVWLSHQHRDAYWRHGSVREDYSVIKAAVLAVGGWGDAYKNAVQALVENVSAPVKGVIGPWIHKYPHFAAPEPRIGFLQEALRWWDRWLKGVATGVEDDPDLRLFVMESEEPKPWYERRKGRWIAQDFRAAAELVLHLNGNALQNAPGPVEAVVDSPADTGLAAGEYCAIWQGPDLPGDQRRDDALSVCFETPVQEDAVEIVGAPEVTLTLESGAPVAQVAVRLNDVHPNGKVSRITYGVLNLTHRGSAERPEALPIGKPVTVRLRLDQIAYLLPEGHRLRLAISNAYWPLIWPAPEPTRLRLTGGTVTIPLACEAGPVSFPKPEMAAHWKTRELRPQAHLRETAFDQRSGVTSLRIVDDFGEVLDTATKLEIGSIAREWWDIHPDDPHSARGRTHWTDSLGRGDWQLRTETYSEMWAEQEMFYLTARIEAYESDILVFERNFRKAIPRDLV